MEYIIGAILAIIVIITVGLILRKRLYDGVDYYEAWKLDIMNRNVAAELSKMKDLNMEGATQESFNTWKDEWDQILTEELATIEELLYDTEKAADKFSFPTAKKHMKDMESILLATEQKIETILADIQSLLETVEANSQTMEELEPQLVELRKLISQNRYQFSKADVRFESAIDEVKEIMNTYNELVEQGEYISSTEQVDLAQNRLENIKTEMDEFPALYKKCKNELPTELNELTNGINEIVEEGYSVNQTDLIVEIGHFQTRLLEAVQTLEKEGTEDVKPFVTELEERIKEIYDQLEIEAIAKNFVETKFPNYVRTLESFETTFEKTKEEVSVLKQAYHFEESDLEKYMTLEKLVTKIRQKLEDLESKITENTLTHSVIRSELEEALAELEQVAEEHETFKKSIANLRKDELEARNQLQQMNEDIYKLNRKLRGSNLPGIPNFIWSLMEEATDKNNKVLIALEQEPLDMIEVQQSLAEAKSAVNHTIDNTDKMMDQAYLTEQVIQYANRYRSSFPELASALEEAERLFRKAEYELALENAAKAVEEIEPGALKRIEQVQTQTV